MVSIRTVPIQAGSTETETLTPVNTNHWRDFLFTFSIGILSLRHFKYTTYLLCPLTSLRNRFIRNALLDLCHKYLRLSVTTHIIFSPFQRDLESTFAKSLQKYSVAWSFFKDSLTCWNLWSNYHWYINIRRYEVIRLQYQLSRILAYLKFYGRLLRLHC